MMTSTMRNQTLKILLVSFFALLEFSNPSFTAGGFGIVDVRLLLVLHPKMACFDYNVGRFFRGGISQKNSRDIKKEMRLAWEKTQPVIVKLMDKQTTVIEHRNELMAQHRDAMLTLNPRAYQGADSLNVFDFSTKSPDKEKKEEKEKENDRTKGKSVPEDVIAKQTMDLDRKYFKDLAAVDFQLAQVQEELQNAQEDAYLPVYFTTKETETAVEEIRKEIFQFISRVAKENGLDVVLDTSFSPPAPSLAKDIWAIPTQQDVSDRLSGRLFNSFTNWDISSNQKSLPMADGKTVDYASHVGPRLVQSKMDDFKRYLDFKPYLTKGIAQFSPGSIFVIGENDITILVARKIFASNKISSEVKKSLEDAIAEYQNSAGPTTFLQADTPAIPVK